MLIRDVSGLQNLPLVDGESALQALPYISDMQRVSLLHFETIDLNDNDSTPELVFCRHSFCKPRRLHNSELSFRW